MSRALRRTTAGAAAILVVAGVVVGAQSRDAQRSTAALQRSRAMQVELKKIEANRQTFVNELFSQWAAVLDPDVYNIWEELGPAAAEAPAWQLYGASLVGDFTAMADILRGVRAAGPYINTLTTPQAKQATGRWAALAVPDPLNLGATTDSLVFTPISPCRVVDTRLTGPRTGWMEVGVPRTFDLSAAGFAKGQGGTAPCPGLPATSRAAWAVNVTVTGYSTSGHLTAWPFGGTMPNSSIINFSAGMMPSVANGQVLTGCAGCIDDIVVQAAARTHMIIDVVGYYDRAVVTASAVTNFWGTQLQLAAGAQDFAYGGTCPAGTTLVGGEVMTNANDGAIVDQWSSPEDPQQPALLGWGVWAVNHDAGPIVVDVASKCMDTPVKVW
ncbi:MAG: hypothetical protein ACE148_12735 [Vicinamibacterales bacterium]